MPIIRVVDGHTGEVFDREMTPEEVAAIPAPEPVRVLSITPRQARLVLLQLGVLDQVAAAIASLPSPQKEAASIEWEYATVIERHSPLLAQLAPALGLSEQQVDELFTAAAAL